MLPGNVTVTAVLGSYRSADGDEVHPGFFAVCQPDCDALNPTFQHLDFAGLGPRAFEDPAATLVLEVRFRRWNCLRNQAAQQASLVVSSHGSVSTGAAVLGLYFCPGQLSGCNAGIGDCVPK